MDFYGIGNTIKGGIHLLLNAARRTGRTTFLIDNLQDGDLVLFASQKDANHFANTARRLGKQHFSTLVLSPAQISRGSLPSARLEGRAIMDHVLVEQLYLHAIDTMTAEIRVVESMLSADKQAPQPLCQFNETLRG